jgi:hypothetical protein
MIIFAPVLTRLAAWLESRVVDKAVSDTVGCKSVPEFAGTLGELPVNRYNRPYDGCRC